MTFHNNKQVLFIISQHVHHLGCQLEFFKNLVFSKIAVFFQLSRKQVFTASNRNIVPIPIPFIANFNYRFTGDAGTAGSMADLGGPAQLN